MKLLSCLSVCVICMGLLACGPRKPAYEDINPQSTKADAANRAAQPGEAAPSAPAPDSQAVPPTPAPAPPEKFRPPVFMDMNRGEARDLPNYPGGVRENIQYGPLNSADTLSLLLHTSDSMDKIAEYYERVIKSNGWTVTSKTRDPEFSEWVLKKGALSEAKVEVRKPPQGSGLYIAVSRVEQQPPPKQ